MARKAMIQKEIKKKDKAKRFYEHRAELRKAAKDLSLSPEEREEAQFKLQKLGRMTSMSRVTNRCRLTGRPRGYLRKFNMSRIAVRENANMGLLPGVTKASW